MSVTLAVPLFVVSLVVTLAAAEEFARRLDRLGVRLRVPEALLGLLTALAADGPELTSAIVALVKGAKGASLGVLVGSNVFNLAAMLGLSALLAGSVRLQRKALGLEGTVGVLATVIAAAVVLNALPAVAGALLLILVFAPYLLLLVRGPELARRLPLPGGAAHGLARALGEREHSHRRRVAADEHPVWRLALMIPPAVALIILGSTGMVEAALTFGDRWHISRMLVAVLILAPATSLPNAFTAVRLGLADRGAAVVSETLNSNTINLAAGVIAPALVVGVAAATRPVALELTILLAMTLICLLFLARPRGMRRVGGATVIALYLIFAALVVVQR